MEINIAILSFFFEQTQKLFRVRELSRLTRINHTTIRQQLALCKKQNLIQEDNQDIWPRYKAKISKEFIQMKKTYNYSQLIRSGLIEYLEDELEAQAIIVFGSYHTAHNTVESDIDICIISPLTKDVNLTRFEKKLSHKIEIHLFSLDNFKQLLNKKQFLINSILSGNTLAGEIELI